MLLQVTEAWCESFLPAPRHKRSLDEPLSTDSICRRHSVLYVQHPNARHARLVLPLALHPRHASDHTKRNVMLHGFVLLHGQWIFETVGELAVEGCFGVRRVW